MPAQVKTYPLYTYNEPVSYNQFNGGINTDPSNEGLLPNELRNGINIEYINDTPKKRRGASQLLEMIYDEDIQKIQGIFLFTLGKPYIFIAADGRLYYSLYYPKQQLRLKELKIIYDEPFQLYKKYGGLDSYTSTIDLIDHDGYVLDGATPYLVFQNKKKIEAASYKDKIYFATGTRFVNVYLNNKMLEAKVVQPYQPNGTEYKIIGMNLLSPYPEYDLNVSKEDGIKTEIHFVRSTQIVEDPSYTSYLFEAVMTFAPGKTALDYYFKWELVDSYSAQPVGWPNNPIIFSAGHDGVQFVSKGRQTIILKSEDIEGKTIRCSFAGTLKDESETIYINETESYNDNTIDKITDWFGSATSSIPLIIGQDTKSSYNIIHSCTKIISDGNKFLLYGDAYNTGEWFKTVIDNPTYITNRGGLSFKTNKNEELLKVIQFKGILICFAFSEYSGGNISIVLGDGDDYNDGSGNYSPYYRKVVHNTITTDNGDTVQIAENVILFKYQRHVYMIEGSELNNEIINIQTVNNKMLHSSPELTIPWDDPNCISEITQDYYALIWDEIRDFIDDEEVIVRPGIRAKMYYKNGYYQNNIVYFPWLVDKSRVFNTTYILQIAGISTHVYNNLLIQYHDDIYRDLNVPFESFIRLKGIDLNYPKFTKFLTSLMIGYQRDYKEPIEFTVRCYNEAGHLLLSAQVLDDKAFFEGEFNKVKLGTAILESNVINTKHRFPAMIVDTLISITSGGSFSLAYLTYNYQAVNVPNTTATDQYKKIIRVGEPMLLTKESFIPKPNEVDQDQITIINAGGADETYK